MFHRVPRFVEIRDRVSVNRELPPKNMHLCCQILACAKPNALHQLKILGVHSFASTMFAFEQYCALPDKSKIKEQRAGISAWAGLCVIASACSDP
jgi:hypothetical protein